MTLLGPQPRVPIQVHVDDAFARVLDPRRERLRSLEQGLLRRALALGIASARDELRHARPSLRERHAGLDSRAARLARGRDDARRVAVALDDCDRLFLQLRLAAQPRRQREQRDEEAGDHGQLRMRSGARHHGSSGSCAGADGPGGPKKIPPPPGIGEGGSNGAMPSPRGRTDFLGEGLRGTLDWSDSAGRDGCRASSGPERIPDSVRESGEDGKPSPLRLAG